MIVDYVVGLVYAQAGIFNYDKHQTVKTVSDSQARQIHSVPCLL